MQQNAQIYNKTVCPSSGRVTVWLPAPWCCNPFMSSRGFWVMLTTTSGAMERSSHAANQRGLRLHMRKVQKSTEKANWQFVPIRIYTHSLLQDSIFERLPLCTETNKQKKKPLLKLLSSHIVLECSARTCAPGSKKPLLHCFLYRTGQDAHALCSQSLGWEQKQR